MGVVALILAQIGPALVSASPRGTADEPIRVLLLSGASNHDWRSTTPRLVEIFEQSGRFTVDVLADTRTITGNLLSGYDVIVSNFNTFTARYQAPRDPGWSPESRGAYESFVRRGKGHVVVHAGSSSFYEWPEYQSLVISSFRVGQTDHGVRHTFAVRIDVEDHPITRGMPPFKAFDELWDGAPVQDGGTVLASAFSSEASGGSGGYEPVAMVRPYGAGRSFTTLLGHDVKAMESVAFQALLTRGTEWAATGTVTLQVPDAWPAIAPQNLPAPPSTPRWLRGDGTIALADGDGEIWRFHHGPRAGKPHFHPLALPGHGPLTWQDPPDHPWHHGLWFSWKHINGVNFWEESRASGRSDGATEWSNVEFATGDDFSAAIELDLAYRVDDGEPALTERRQILITPPGPDGRYHLDWTMTFTAARDVLLDRTPLPGEPGGKVYGGYAGLSVRLTSALRQRQAVSADGPVSFERQRHRSRARAFDYNGLVNGVPMGIAILDHEYNPNTPSPWYVIRGDVMSFFSPAVIAEGPRSLTAGETMTLRYRIIVHPGRWTATHLAREHARFGPDHRE
jgi:type 1 glutamine amidotransferase